MELDNVTLVDLTHSLSAGAPTWSGSCGFCLKFKSHYETGFCIQEIQAQAGIGTHIDAPLHCFPNSCDIANIPLEKLVLPLHIIDVRKKASPNYEISVDDIDEYEASYGTISKNSLVIGFTGWSRFWNDSKAYRNEDESGKMLFPSFSKKAAQALLTKEIAAVGIDTLSPDCQDLSFPVHKLILGSGKYIIENIADCSKLPPHGSFAIALPLKIESGTESPIRLIGLIPKS